MRHDYEQESVVFEILIAKTVVFRLFRIRKRLMPHQWCDLKLLETADGIFSFTAFFEFRKFTWKQHRKLQWVFSVKNVFEMRTVRTGSNMCLLIDTDKSNSTMQLATLMLKTIFDGHFKWPIFYYPCASLKRFICYSPPAIVNDLKTVLESNY